MAQISHQPRPRTCHRRVCFGKPHRFHHCRVLSRRHTIVCGQGANGFVPHTRRAVAAKLKGLKIATCPFANLPEQKRTQWALTKEEMKNCTWVKPEVVAQIEFAEWTPDAHLRQPAFVGLREDKDPREVVREVES